MLSVTSDSVLPSLSSALNNPGLFLLSGTQEEPFRTEELKNNADFVAFLYKKLEVAILTQLRAI